MTVAIVGSRSFPKFDLTPYIPEDTTEIVSGGAIGVDSLAKEYAIKHNIKLTEYIPDYSTYGKSAPLVRNDIIIDKADLVLIFWNGKSKGSQYVIERCKKLGVSFYIYLSKDAAKGLK